MAAVIIFAVSLWNFLLQNSIRSYPVKGIDVSHHQGRIDWKQISGVDFVFIKATEGKDFVDPRFFENWEGARLKGIPRGAYHFFRFGTDGGEQAKHFLATVKNESGLMRPVVDVEFAGNRSRKPSVEEFQQELQVYMEMIREEWGDEPIVYTDRQFLNTYLKWFPIKTLWIRETAMIPPGKLKWQYWQYSDRGRIEGISGNVDLNIFRGVRDELIRP